MMTPEIKSKLKMLLSNHKNYRYYPLTKISEAELDNILEKDVDYFYNYLSNKFAWFKTLNQARKIALLKICFMGIRVFMESTFEHMIEALEAADYPSAATHFYEALSRNEDTLDIAKILETGTIPVDF